MTTTDIDPEVEVSSNGIIFANSGTVVQVDPSYNIEWCITKQLEAELKAAEAVDPLLLVIVTRGNLEVDRFVAPLAAMKMNIILRYPGENNIIAVAIWSSKHSSRKIRQTITERKKNGFYRYEALVYADPRIAQLSSDILDLRYEVSYCEDDIRRLKRQDFVAENIYDPGETADEDEKRVFALESEIAERRREIWEIRNPDVDNTEAIANCEAKLQDLSAKLAKLCMELDERRVNPQMEWQIATNVKDSYDLFEHFPTAKNYGVHQIIADEKLYAKEPNRFMVWAGSLLPWPNTPKVQCDLRRRVLVTLLIFWPWLLIKLAAQLVVTAVFAVVYLCMLIYGLRDINFRYLRHPFEITSLSDFGNCRDARPRWYTKKKADAEQWHHSNQYEVRSPFLVFVNPLTIVCALLLGVLFRSSSSSWLYLLLLPLALVVIGGVVMLFGKSFNRLMGNLSEWYASRTKKKRQEAILATQREIHEISCELTFDRPIAGVSSALPRKGRVSYIVANTKAKVCKPFPGS